MNPPPDPHPSSSAASPGQAPGRPPWLGAAGSTRRVLARNALWTWATFLANAVALFLLAGYLIRDLGDAHYGFWSFFLALTGAFGLVDLGVRPAVVHFIARHDALGDLAGVNRHVNAAFRVFTLGGLLFLVLTLLCAWWLPRSGHLGPVSADDAVSVALIVGIEIAITFPFNAFSAVLIGRQRFDVVGRIDLVVLVLRTGVTIALVENGHGLVALAWAHAVAGVVEIAWKSWAAFRELPGLRFRWGGSERAAVRSLLAYGGWAIFISVALTLTWQTDPVLIWLVISSAAVPHFTQPASLPTQTRALLWAACRVLAPAAGALHARGDSTELARMLVRASRAMLFLAGPILAYLVALGGPFLAAWLGEGYRGDSQQVLTIMALAMAAPIASQPLVQLLYGVNRLRPLALTYLAEGLANLGLSLALIGPLGIVGVAWGTAVPAVLFHMVLLPAQVVRPFGLSWARFTLDVWTLPLVCGTLTWLVLTLVSDPQSAYGWGALVGFALLALATQAAWLGALHLLRRARPGQVATEETA